MAKKQRVSEAIQNKFNKPQFKPGDAVHFHWLGQKLYGHVKKTKQIEVVDDSKIQNMKEIDELDNEID